MACVKIGRKHHENIRFNVVNSIPFSAIAVYIDKILFLYNI